MAHPIGTKVVAHPIGTRGTTFDFEGLNWSRSHNLHVEQTAVCVDLTTVSILYERERRFHIEPTVAASCRIEPNE